MKKIIESIRKNPFLITFLNLLLCGGAVAYNSYNQGFCKPVDWSFWLLLTCFLPLIFFPVIRYKIPQILLPVVFFIFGLSMAISFYCICFLQEVNLLGLILLPFIIGVFIYTPHIFIIQVVYYLRIEIYTPFRKYCYLGLLVSCTITLFVGLEYQKAYQHILSVDKTTDKLGLKGSYMEEKILGAHFKYHTQICLFDGWRPPLHDPFLVIGRWINQVDLTWELEKRVRFYQQVFPKKRLIQNCSCAMLYSDQYYTDELLNRITTEEVDK